MLLVRYSLFKAPCPLLPALCSMPFALCPLLFLSFPFNSSPMSTTRQLAAIMFTDIVGYTAMMQSDEHQAVTIIKHYNSTLEKCVSRYHGRVANFYGDGSLCLFNSATEAVECAVEIQKELRRDPVVPLRIGLHIGEVFFEDEKALGDGVNVASRIQSLGQQNTILVSAEIHDKIRNNSSISSISLGLFNFKNVGKPMEVFALTTEGLTVPQRNKMAGKLEPKNKSGRYIPIILAAAIIVFFGLQLSRSISRTGQHQVVEKSIAVLPFTDMSQAKDQAYFSDGLTEDIITQLAKIKAFKVTSRISVMQYKTNQKSLKEIGQELGAAIILEGSVQRAGEKVRITAQLIKAATDEHLWAETYDRTMDDIFSIQSDIASKIAAALKASLSAEEENEIQKKYTENAVAYQLYLQGRYFWNQRLEEPVRKSIDYFKQAITADSSYALAYAGLGDAYLMLGVYSALRPDESFPLAKSYAQKAIQLDPTLAEAYATLIDIHIHYDWDAAGAEEYFQQTIRLNPAYANAYHWHSEVYDMQLQFDKAIEESRKALARDPYNTIINMQLGKNYIYAGDCSLAVDQLQKTLLFDSTNAYAQYNIGLAYTGLKQYDRAMYHFEKATQLGNGDTRMKAGLGFAKAASGHKEAAQQILDDLILQSKTSYVPAYDLATLYIGIGQADEAMKYLFLALANREPWMPFISMNPFFTTLKNNKEFEVLVSKIGTNKN